MISIWTDGDFFGKVASSVVMEEGDVDDVVVVAVVVVVVMGLFEEEEEGFEDFFRLEEDDDDEEEEEVRKPFFHPLPRLDLGLLLFVVVVGLVETWDADVVVDFFFLFRNDAIAVLLPFDVSRSPASSSKRANSSNRRDN